MANSKTVTYRVEFNSKELKTGLEQLNATIQGITKEQKKLRKENKQGTAQFSKNAQTLKQLKKEQALYSRNLQNQIKIERDNNIVTKRKIGHLEKLKAELSQVTAKINTLSKAELNNSKIGGQLIQKQAQLTSELKKYEQAGNRFYRNVGNYTSALKGLWTQFKSFVGIYSVIRLFKAFITTTKEFEQEMANLAAVMGVSRKETKELEKHFRYLGKTTQYTAKEVAQLATALARLGFSSKDIKNMTKPVLTLASALKTDLASAGELTGSVIRAFGYSTKDTTKVVDLLSKSTTISALSFDKLQTALPIVGTVAKNAGVDLSTVVAQLGELTNKGIDASTAATGLRNVYLELAKKGLTLEQAMNMIKTSTDKNKTALALFGKRASTVGVILSETTPEIEKMDEALKKSQGTADEMNKKQLNTLEGSIKLLKSAWDEFLLSLNESGGVTDKLKVGFQWLAKNLSKVLKYIGLIITSFVAYKTTLIALNLATKAYTFVTGLATGAMKGFNLAMKANVIGLVVSGLVTLITYLNIFKEDTKKATKAQKELNKVMQEGSDITKDTKDIENRYKIIHTLNKRQLKELQEDIKTQTKIEEDYTATLLKNAQKIFDNDSTLKDLQRKSDIAYANYKKGINKQLNESIIASLEHQIRERKILLSKDLESQNQIHSGNLSKLKKMYNETLKVSPINTDDSKVSEDVKNYVDKAKKKWDEQMKETVFSLAVKIEISKLNLSKSEALKKVYDNNTQAIEDFASKYSNLSDEMKQIDVNRLSQTLKLTKKQTQAYIVIQEQYSKNKKSVEDYYKKFEEVLTSSNSKIKEQTNTITQSTNSELLLLNQKLRATKKESQEELDIKIKILEETNKKEIESFQKSQEYTVLSEEKRKAIIKAMREGTNYEISALMDEYRQNELQKDEEMWNRKIAMVQKYVSEVSKFTSYLTQYQQAQFKKEEINLENSLNSRYKKDLEYYQAIVDNEKSTVQQKAIAEKMIQNINNQAARERDNLARAQFEQAKKMRITEAIMNGAAAIVAAWNTTIPAPAGQIIAAAESAVIAGITAVQIDNIKKEGYSKLAEGGYLALGSPHTAGGIKLANGREVEQGEYVINAASTKKYRPLVDYINNTGNGGRNNEDVNALIDEDSLAQKIGEVINNKKVYVVSTEITDQQKVDLNIIKKSQF